MLCINSEENPKKPGEKAKPPVPSKENKPKIVPTNHPSNRPRDPTAITSLYQMKNNKKTPLVKPSKPAKLKENAKNPEKKDDETPNPFFGRYLPKKERRITVVVLHDTIPDQPIDKEDIID